MNCIVIHSGHEDMLKRLDKRFEVVTRTPETENLPEGVSEIEIYDRRDKANMRAELRNVYKTMGVITN